MTWGTHLKMSLTSKKTQLLNNTLQLGGPMARQAKCTNCRIHYLFKKEVSLSNPTALCPVCGTPLQRTTHFLTWRVLNGAPSREVTKVHNAVIFLLNYAQRVPWTLNQSGPQKLGVVTRPALTGITPTSTLAQLNVMTVNQLHPFARTTSLMKEIILRSSNKQRGV